MGYLDTA